MALVKFGGGIIEMRGSIAGTVFSRNSTGNYARAKTTPINPNTALQQTVRAAMAFLTDRWSNTLTANQRIAWNLYASSVQVLNRIGESVNISGFNHYIRSNMIRKQYANPLIDDGPTVFEIPAADPTYSISVSEGTQIITHSFDDTMDWAVEDGSFLFFYGGKPQNPQIFFFDGPWRKAGFIGGVDPGGPIEPHAAASEYAVAEGQHIWTYGRISRADGRLSEKFRADTFCAA